MGHSKQTHEYDAFLKILAEELLDMPDSEVLDMDDHTDLQKENVALIAKAKVAAGRRRLATGRAAFEASKTNSKVVPDVSVSAARAAIEAAMNDEHYTLAARSLGEMSDEDILRLYHQIERLKSIQDKPDGGQ